MGGGGGWWGIMECLIVSEVKHCNSTSGMLTTGCVFFARACRCVLPHRHPTLMNVLPFSAYAWSVDLNPCVGPSPAPLLSSPSTRDETDANLERFTTFRDAAVAMCEKALALKKYLRNKQIRGSCRALLNWERVEAGRRARVLYGVRSGPCGWVGAGRFGNRYDRRLGPRRPGGPRHQSIRGGDRAGHRRCGHGRSVDDTYSDRNEGHRGGGLSVR